MPNFRFTYKGSIIETNYKSTNCKDCKIKVKPSKKLKSELKLEWENKCIQIEHEKHEELIRLMTHRRPQAKEMIEKMITEDEALDLALNEFRKGLIDFSPLIALTEKDSLLDEGHSASYQEKHKLDEASAESISRKRSRQF